MAELDVSWAGDSQPQQLSTANLYGRYVLGTSVSVFGPGFTASPPEPGAYKYPNIDGTWVTAPFFSPTGVNAGAYAKGDSTGKFAGALMETQTAWDWMSIVPAYSQPFMPTQITTYFWG